MAADAAARKGDARVSEQRLALVGAELETRLLADGKRLAGKVLCYHSWSDCMAALPEAAPDVLVGLLPDELSLDRPLIQRMQQDRHLAVIVLATASQLPRALHLYQHGAFEYLPADCDDASLVAVVQQALRRYRTPAPVLVLEPERSGALIGESAAVRELHRALQQLSKVSVPVLIRGEQGTGKRLFARRLHENSRVAGPLVMVNVSAMDRTNIDVELFGLERVIDGSNQVVHIGKVEQANGGVLFLDEIADLPLDAQIRLAQLLADGHYHRVGGYGACSAQLRIVAATRHALESLVRNGQFQSDLYHRLTVVQVQLPRLQERREDIPALAQHFLAEAAAEIGVEPKQLAPTVLPVLQQYDWPGNVRQLENLCRRLAVMVPERLIEPAHLPLEMQPALQIASEARSWEDALRSWAERALAGGQRNLLDVAQPVLERILLQAALKQTGGLKQEAALLLGWGRNTLTRKLRELQIESDDDDEAA